jgi:transposase
MMVCLRIPTVRFQQESLSALNRPGCPFSARILVLFQQELMSALLRKCCPLSARTGVRFEQDFALNEALIEKTQKLLGIKGYYTNLEESVIDNKTVIERYHELYKIEQAFRISKNDLQTRPIFHFKEQPIKLHILICFMALVVSKHIELKTGISIRRFIDESKKIVDGEILNHITQKVVTVKAQPTQKMKELIAKLEAPH